MVQWIVKIVIGVAVAVTTALILRAMGAGEFTQGLWAGTLGTIVNHITGDYMEEREGK
jgi:hypothetical protein